MDIWAWVEEFTEQLAGDGQQRLAYEILHLPSLVVDNRHDEVDRLVPGLLGAARERKHPWLEIYVRHWNLQSRVLKRYEVKGLLPEAIDLLDFANQEETSGCPQSICVVQDLAKCYAETDGPGYAQERLDVAKETLARIDPSWPCFRCISGEYASALRDLGRTQEALAFCQQQLAAMGSSGDPYAFRESRVEALIELGRLEEALAFNDKADNPGGGDGWVIHKTIDQARILSRLGRFDEAKATLPAFEVVIETPAYFRDWTDAVEQLVAADAFTNNWELDLQLRVMALRLEDNGALRDAWRLQALRARLSLDRDRPWVAQHAVQAMSRIIDQLERPLDAPAQTEVLQARVTQAESEADVEVFDSPEANLEADAEPDLSYERFRRALQRWPTNESLWLGWSRAAGVLGRATEIVASGRAFSERNPEAWQVAIVTGQTMVALGDLDEAEAWADAAFTRLDNTELRASARFIQALAAEQRGDRALMKRRLQDVIEFDPHARNSRVMLSALAREAGDYDEALEHLDILVQIEPETPSHHWDRIVVGTVEDQWDVVRASGAALGMEFATSEGPIQENWGVCRVQLRDDAGTAFELHALRTGPVTAQIIEVSAPDMEPQYYGASVVFDPRPLNPPTPEEGADDEEKTPLIFPLVEVLNASVFRAFAIDGVKPTTVQFEALRANLENVGAVMQVRSGDDYQIEHPDHGPRDAAYWYLAVPENAPLEVLAERLAALEEAVDGPLVWPQLALAAGQDERVAAQQRAISEWALM